jgi:hypothetical protein
MLPLEVVDDPRAMDQAAKEVQRLEDLEPDGFNKAIRALMSRQLPQPTANCWPDR